MNTGKYVFTQLVEFMDRNSSNYLAKKYGGDKYVKSYTCWNQLLTMMFGQLSNRESLRDLIVAMEAHAEKLYHLGINKSATRSVLCCQGENQCKVQARNVETEASRQCGFRCRRPFSDAGNKHRDY